MAAGGAAQIIFSATAPPAAFFQIHLLVPAVMGKPVSLYFITHGISKDGRLFRRLNSLTYNMITKTF